LFGQVFKVWQSKFAFLETFKLWIAKICMTLLIFHCLAKLTFWRWGKASFKRGNTSL